MTEFEARAIFVLGGIEVTKLHRLENKYWPDSYVELRQRNPWWLVETPFGLIEIGWRKRVISINWESTGVPAEVTKDDVTKDKFMVHAWSYPKAVEYMISLNNTLRKHKETSCTNS